MTEPEPTSANGVPTSSPDREPGPGRAAGRSKYSRVLLKLGGEMFGGGQVGLDPDVVAQVARQIAEVVRDGVAGHEQAVRLRGQSLVVPAHAGRGPIAAVADGGDEPPVALDGEGHGEAALLRVGEGQHDEDPVKVVGAAGKDEAAVADADVDR